MRSAALGVTLVFVAVVGGVLPGAVGAAGAAGAVGGDAGLAVVGGGAGPTGDVDGTGAFQTGRIDADGVLLRVDVAPDGDANWTVKYRIRLQNRSEGFESLRRDVEANASRYREQFGTRMSRTAATASEATEREMTVGNVTVAARTQFVPEEYGFVTYRFHWEGFAAADGDRLIVGDALAGLFLDERTTLVIGWPSSYEATEVRPTPADSGRESAAAWSGPTDFGSGEPRVTLTPGSRAGAGGPVGAGALAAVAAVAAVAVVGVAWYRRGGVASVEAGPDGPAAGDVGGPVASGSRRDGAPAPAASPDDGSTSDADGVTDGDGDAGVGDDSGPGAGPGSAADAGSGDGVGADVPAGPDVDDGVDAGSGEGDGGDDADGGGDRVPMELLSPEERVLRLVNDGGGRIKQQAVVKELDWSAARTSQVVGSLRESGDIETFRLGRENVLKLPDDDDSAT